MKQKYIFPFFVLFGFLASIVFGIHNDVLAQEAASFPISLEEASRRAVEYTKLGAPSLPSSQLAYDSKNTPWYVVDFLRFSDSPKGWFWRMRVVIDPHTGALVTDERVLKEFFVEEGAIPPGIDPDTKEVLLSISIKDAERRAAEQAQLGPEFSVFKTKLVYDSQNLPWYVVDFVKYDTYAKQILWGRRVVVSPYDGTIAADERVLNELEARQIDVPPDFDPRTKQLLSARKTLSSDLKRLFQSGIALLFTIIALLALAIGIVYWRKKIIRLSYVDIVFGAAMIVQLFFAFYLYRYSLDTMYIWLLISAFSTLTYWVTTRVTTAERGVQEELAVILPKDLPKFSDVGGMEKVKEELRNTVGLIFAQGKLTQQYGVNFNGVLLFGPPGVGKSYIAKATAGEFGLNLLSLKVSDLIGIYKSTSAHKIQQAFKTALKQAPCLLFFDEFESVAAARGVVSPDIEDTRVVNQLLRSLEEIRGHPGKVIVFAATNKKEDLDEAIIRPGRFDKQIYIPMPDDAARKSIIETRLRGKPLGSNINLDELVGKTVGMSAADIAAIVDKAVLDILSASLGATPQAKALDQKQLVWAIDNFREKQKPLVKKLNWSDLILQEEVIKELKRFVKIIENPDITRKLGIESPKGVLIYGPPGTGKTTIAKVIANEANASFFSIGPGDIYNKWLGESERNIKNIFAEARKYKPSIIFMDEIDSIMARRGGDVGFWADKLVNQILQEMDGMQDTSHVFIIGATNAPDAVDPAVLRGGRLSTQIEIPLPGQPEREKLFALFLKKTSKAADVNLSELADLTGGYSGADIQDICQRVILDVFDRSGGETKEITHADLKTSLQKYKKSSKVYHVPEYFKKRTEEGLSTQDIAERFNQTVVVVINKSDTWKEGEPVMLGSGVFLSDNGIIATNFHVIRNAATLEIKLINGVLFQVKKILGLGKNEDIAIVSVDATRLPYATLGDSNQVMVGERVVAIGNPRGLAHTVSDGIVSARRVVEGQELIQITAPISPGSSGGPVFNSKGEVIGIAKMIILDSQNLNFVIPSNSIKALFANPGEIPMSAIQQAEGKDKTE